MCVHISYGGVHFANGVIHTTACISTQPIAKGHLKEKELNFGPEIHRRAPHIRTHPSPPDKKSQLLLQWQMAKRRRSQF